MTEEERAKIHAELATVYDRVARNRAALAATVARLDAMQVRTAEINRRLMAHAAELEGKLANDRLNQPAR